MIRHGRSRALVVLVTCSVLAMTTGCSSPDGSSTRPSTSGLPSAPVAPTDNRVSAPVDPPDTTSATEAPPAPAAEVLAGRVIVVDPGHNGANAKYPAQINQLVDAGGFQKACNTTGTASGDLTESRFNWETAQRLRSMLEAAGATVVLTRPSDDGWGPCVDQRGLMAERSKADLLVSIHADGADPSASGFHVIRPATGAVVTEANNRSSARLAEHLRDALVARGFAPATYVGGRSGIVERSDIATVNRAGVPAVMLESGNMHNAGDLALLRSPEVQQRIADALAAAVTAFLA